jgi:hypothetical protein
MNLLETKERRKGTKRDSKGMVASKSDLEALESRAEQGRGSALNHSEFTVNSPMRQPSLGSTGNFYLVFLRFRTFNL